MQSQQPNRLVTICSLIVTLCIMIALVYGAISWGFKGQMPATAHWVVLGLGGGLILAAVLLCAASFRRGSTPSRRVP